MNSIFISLPLSGRSLEESKARCDIAKEKYTKDGDRVVTPFDVIEDLSMPYALCVAKRMEAVLGSDHVVFLDGWADSKTCNLENMACHLYNIDYHVDARI